LKTTAKGQSQLAMARQLQFNEGQFLQLRRHCQRRGIMFLSSPSDLSSIDALCRLGLKIFKVPSGEITNLPYLRKIGALKKSVILSTGMCSLKEIRAALDVLVRCGTSRKRISILHCNTEYPTPYRDVHLRAMQAMRRALGVEVGYSDHTPGIEVSLAAVALGASVIEKHFTLDKDLPGPDHKASLSVDELAGLVRAVRNVEKAMGRPVKKPSPSEIRNLPVVRKSIVAFRDIRKGEILGEDNLYAKRPGTGISPMHWDKVLGRRAPRDFKEDELIILK
ncbi:MAG: N-acetylneuraminate synthase family protein, partial [Candidatus Omnitrophica bacterium]|nr:N-acetylneuraminate synthase family protein [Candidatus Omnitrophota bacterium]